LIFVTVGTPIHDFSRLVKAVDDLVASKKIKEKVVVQLGYTKYIPKNCEWFRFAKPEKIEELSKTCRIYISHSGIGSLMIPLEYRKPVIAVPRLREFGEHIDNHQLQIAKEMEKEGRIVALYNVDKLEDAIRKASVMKIKYSKRESKIIKIIEKFLEGVQK
jgi:UDP-N-acetylglucosamine transferase subunit ALG13